MVLYPIIKEKKMNFRRKIAVLAIGLMLGSGVGAFAADLGWGFGGGAILGYSWSKSETNPTDVKFYGIMPAEMTFAYKTHSFDSGVFLFADCTYVELTAGYIFQTGKVTDIEADVSGQPQSKDDVDYKSHLIIIDLLGKYPFILTGKLSVFPAFGVGSKFAVGGNEFSDNTHDVLWGLSLKAGGGVDYALTDAIFLRGEILYYFQIASDKDAKIAQEPELKKSAFHFANVGYYMGPQIKIAAGYKLKKS
jgi:opacity protein-like surface antigen